MSVAACVTEATEAAIQQDMEHVIIRSSASDIMGHFLEYGHFLVICSQFV